MIQYPHWFVAEDDDHPGLWSIYLETGDGIIPSLSKRFKDENDANLFLDNYLSGTKRGDWL